MTGLAIYIVFAIWRRIAWAKQHRITMAKYLFCSAAIAWVLAKTSDSWLGNMPAAALILLSIRWLLLQTELSHKKLHYISSKPHDEAVNKAGMASKPVQFAATSSSVPYAQQWRHSVKSPVVEHAWEALCGSIIQEFIYDTWYASLTPDKEFPADVRRLLNNAFGNLAVRSRRLDLRAMLNDMSELLMEQIELFRDTRDSILSSHGPVTLVNMTPAARERAFRQEMRAENNLHPALQTPEGHYKFLKSVSEALVAQVLDEEDLQRVATRVICRELLAGAVLRPLLMWCTPYFANKAMYSMLKAETSNTSSKIPDSEISSATAAARSEQMRGHFEFEQRVRRNAAEEDSAIVESCMSKASTKQTIETASCQKLSRSHSWDALPQKSEMLSVKCAHDDLSGSLHGMIAEHDGAQLLGEEHDEGGQGKLSHADFKSSSSALPAATALPLGAQQRRAVTLPTPSLECDSAMADMKITTLSAGSQSAPQPPLSSWPSSNAMQHAGSSEQQQEFHTKLHCRSAAFWQGPTDVDGRQRRYAPEHNVQQRPYSEEEPLQTVLSQGDNVAAVALFSTSPLSLPMPRPFKKSSEVASNKDCRLPCTTREGHFRQRENASVVSTPVVVAELMGWEHVDPTRSPTETDAQVAGSDRAASLNSPCIISHSPTISQETPADDDVCQTQQEFSTAGNSLSGHLLASAVDTTRVKSSLASSTSQLPRSEGFAKFSQRPTAKVVAADLISSGSKDYVVYKIRVSDGPDEWTVSRRFRNFETLHKQLRMLPGYRLKLPAKRIFTHSQNVDFVEERREALDRFLQDALSCNMLEGDKNMWEFLRNGSDVYELQPSTRFLRGRPGAKPSEMVQRRKSLVSDMSASQASIERCKSQGRVMLVHDGRHKKATTLTEQQEKGLPNASAHSLPQTSNSAACDHSCSKADAATACADRAGTLAITGPQDQEDSMARRTYGQKCGSPSPSHKKQNYSGSSRDSVVQSAGVAPSPKSLTGLSGSKAAGLLSRASKKAAKGVSSANLLAALSRSQSHSDMAEGLPEEAGLSGSPPKKGIFRRKSRAGSPVKEPQKQARLPDSMASAVSLSFASSTASKSSLDNLPRPPTRPPSSDPEQSFRGLAMEAAVGSTSAGTQAAENSAADGVGSFGMEDCAGISAPLYEIVDCVFQLQTRGFFRRQVFGVARQVLSLVAGDAIDVYLLSRLKLLRQAHTIARLLQSIQGSLWPGGTWFQYLPQHQAQQAEQPKQGRPSPRKLWTMQADKYLEPWGHPPLDEEEIREAVYNLLMSQAPSPLVRLVGRSAYISGIEDLFGLLQSSTFVQQLGYGLLHIAVIHMFPELKQFLKKIEREGVW